MTHAPTEDELQRAIFDHLARSGEFMPDVDVKGLRELPREPGQYDAEVFLSFARFRQGGNADALRDALTRARRLRHRRHPRRRVSDVELVEDVPAVFTEGREHVVLASVIRFSV